MRVTLTDEDREAIAWDIFRHGICRHKWRFAGSRPYPADEKRGYPAGSFTAHDLPWHLWPRGDGATTRKALS